MDEFQTGAADNDQDADDLPQSNGTPSGHADCVPSSDGDWPAIQEND